MLAVPLLMMICLSCVLQCVQRLIAKSTKNILLVEKEGGDVEMQLESRTESIAQLITEVDMFASVGHKLWQAVQLWQAVL